MRNQYLGTIVALLAGAGLALAQVLSAPEPNRAGSDLDTPSSARPDSSKPAASAATAPFSAVPAGADGMAGPGADLGDGHCDGQACIVWARGEYLLWWSKDTPLPRSVVTSGSPTDVRPGAIGQPGTQTLFGGPEVGLG